MKNVSDVYPLTPMQQLMLIHAQSSQDSDTLFSQFQYTIRGPLDHVIFQQAWQYIVNRHTALQTIFLWKDLKQPLQVVKKETNLPWVYEDWRDLSATEQQTQLTEYLKADKAKGFEFDRSPPMRLALFRLENQAYHLVWSNHHLTLDRWCLAILADELPIIYANLVENKPLNLPPARAFKSYISWIQQQPEEAAKGFWRSEFQDYDDDLPLNAVRSSVTSLADPEDILHKSKFPVNLVEKVQRFSKATHLTKSTLLQSAWGLLMAHYNNRAGATIGVTVSGRPADLPGVENIVGTFINNLPVRMTFDGKQQLLPWLKENQKKMSRMQKYDYVSMDNILQWSDLPYDNPLFDSLFVYQQAASLEQPITNEIKMGGIPEGATSNFPITLTVEASDDRIVSWISFTSNDFSKDVVKTLAAQFQQVLNWMVLNPEATLEDLELFSEEERQALDKNRADWHQKIEEKSHTNRDGRIETPRNSLEALIAEIWADLLQLESVGINQNFIDLGGSSLLAVRLLDVIEERTGVQLPISVLFDSPNVRTLAEVVAQGDWKPRWETLVAINDVSRTKNAPLYLVPPSATSAIHFAELAKHLEVDYPVYSFTPMGLDTDKDAQDRVEDMASLYLREIRDVQPDGPYHIAGSCFGNLVAYEMAQQLESQGEETTLITIDPFYLTQWKPEKRSLFYYLQRTWHFLRSGVLLSEFVMRTSGLFRRRRLQKQDRTKKVLNSHDIARTSYVVRAFPGKMNYLQSEENHRLGYHLRWNELNQGPHESFVLDETNHGNLLSSDNLQRVAATIKSILKKNKPEL